MSAVTSRIGRLVAAAFAAVVLAFTGFGVGTAAAHSDSDHGDSGYSWHDDDYYDDDNGYDWDDNGYDNDYDNGRGGNGHDNGRGGYGHR